MRINSCGSISVAMMVSLALVLVASAAACGSESDNKPPENIAPIIHDVGRPAQVDAGKAVILQVFATDPDGDELTYRWNTIEGGGEFETQDDPSSSISYLAPTEPVSVLLEVEVDDKKGGTASRKFRIIVVGTPGSPVQIPGLQPPVPPTPEPSSTFALTIDIFPDKAALLGATVGGAGNRTPGEKVSIGAVAETECLGTSNYVFDRWEGADGVPNENPGSVVMGADRTVTAIYSLVEESPSCLLTQPPEPPTPEPSSTFTLTIDISPVEAELLGAVVGGAGVRTPGEEVSIGAVAETKCIGRSNYAFDHWKGADGIPNENPGFVVMSADRTVTAIYSLVEDSPSCLLPEPLEQRPPSTINASVGGNVADSNGDGLGDNRNELPGPAPSLISAAIKATGGPGSNGTLRMQFEWDLSTLMGTPPIASATVVLHTSEGSIDKLDTFFFHGTTDQDGVLNDSDFHAAAASISNVVMAVIPDRNVFTFDVTNLVQADIDSGHIFFSIQGRVDESLTVSSIQRGLQVRSTATSNSADLRPQLVVTWSE